MLLNLPQRFLPGPFPRPEASGCTTGTFCDPVSRLRAGTNVMARATPSDAATEGATGDANTGPAGVSFADSLKTGSSRSARFG